MDVAAGLLGLFAGEDGVDVLGLSVGGDVERFGADGVGFVGVDCVGYDGVGGELL